MTKNTKYLIVSDLGLPIDITNSEGSAKRIVSKCYKAIYSEISKEEAERIRPKVQAVQRMTSQFNVWGEDNRLI